MSTSTSRKSREQLAKLADTSYQKFNATRRHWLKGIDSSLSYESDISNAHIAVIKDNSSNDIYISHRGTKTNDFSDLSADLAIAVGSENLHKRFKEADTHFEKVKEKYGDDKNYIVVGHSLGGALGRSVAKKHDLEAHLFNLGSGIGDVRNSLTHKLAPEKKRENDITHYTTGKDPISLLGTLPGSADKIVKVDVKEGVSNAHSLANFF